MINLKQLKVESVVSDECDGKQLKGKINDTDIKAVVGDGFLPDHIQIKNGDVFDFSFQLLPIGFIWYN